MAHDVHLRGERERSVGRSLEEKDGRRSQTTLSRPRILLVEDEAPFRDLVQAYLREQGFEVRPVQDGKCGARWLREHPVDVLITDLCMPNSDGIELLMGLRKLRSRIPIIVMSGGVGGDSDAMLRAATLLGARHTLAKPFALENLGAAVREALAGR